MPSPRTSTERPTQRTWKLSPSDFAFLWEQCKRCFYLKVVHNIRSPSGAFPGIFSKIDSQMKRCFKNQRTETITTGLPKGVLGVEDHELWVESRPIAISGLSSTCYVTGKADTLITFDDGSYGVIDFKTSDPREEHVALYARQLHAYAYALEHAAPGKLARSPVSKLGLLVYEPTSFENHGGSKVALQGGLHWLEIPRDEAAFLEFLTEVVAVLEQPSPPAGATECLACQYRETSRITGL